MKSLADLHNALESIVCTTDYRSGAEFCYHWLTQLDPQSKLPPAATAPGNEWTAPHAITNTSTPALDLDAPIRTLSLECAKKALGMECGCYVDTWSAISCTTAESDAASEIYHLISPTIASLRTQLAEANARADKAEAERDQLAESEARYADLTKRDATLATYRALIEKAVEALSACIHDSPGWSPRCQRVLVDLTAAIGKEDRT